MDQEVYAYFEILDKKLKEYEGLIITPELLEQINRVCEEFTADLFQQTRVETVCDLRVNKKFGRINISFYRSGPVV
jgi:hypothetical protein